MELNTLIGPMFALGGVYLGFILNSKVEEKKYKKDELKFRREKLEQLYFHYLKWEGNFISVYLQNIYYYKGEITFIQLAEILKENDKDVPDMHKRIRITINLYFPELLTEYENLDNARSNVSNFLGINQKEKYTIDEFIKSQHFFEKASKQFIYAIIQKSKMINS